MRISEVVEAMSPPRYTVSQAAVLVGKSVDTLKRWRRNDVHRPSDRRQFGSLSVDLYTPEDIVAMRKIAKTMKPGPKPGK